MEIFHIFGINPWREIFRLFWYADKELWTA